MTKYKIDMVGGENESLPGISLTIEGTNPAVVHSDSEMQGQLISRLQQNRDVTIFDMGEGLYERLTVEQNVSFFHKWFGCSKPLPEILVMFELHRSASHPLKTCSVSELRRVYFAKQYMMSAALIVFREPIQGVNLLTINTFMNMLQELVGDRTPVLILVSNMEHAILLSNSPYSLRDHGLHKVQMETEEMDVVEDNSSASPSVKKLFKVPAKIDDKVILFDPPEIDYIESQDGKSQIVINNESYTMDSTLAEIEKRLEFYGFYRCHRSYVVNLQKVREIITWSKNTYSLRINNKSQSTIPLSRTKVQEIQHIFNLK
ncbi:LytTR family transcriptional regulator DNA-binding domain-containing protein [Virgibacillus ihumii]|uniref:LytTR family transcriptional regulator DNA-binding domain-containing protein n=1 Tax=Virgibacillus ihumii TaxID=2686091 RepID=UPI00157D2143|nr:LytTR family transcriptional regulator DNA-binding domain-containing protein [Virgibacillus ihumii]